MRRPDVFVVVGALVLFGTPHDAYAYLDPGTGSMILQAAMATLFAAAFTLKLYWQRFKLMFKRQSAGGPDHGDRQG